MTEPAAKLIRPVPGRRVRDPGAGFDLLPAAGRHLVVDSWWQRRLNDGDVEIVNEQLQPAPPADEA